jgi:hypothetical protein
MLRSVKSVNGFTVQTRDASIGTVCDFLFDNSWQVQYLVVELAHHHSERQVMIAATMFGRPVWESRKFPVLITREQVQNSPERGDEQQSGSSFHSTQEIRGYRIRALDGEIGSLTDFIVDDDKWGLHYIVVKTMNRQPERDVLLATDWITDVRWKERMVSVDLPQERIQQSPEYNPADPVNREYEIRLYDFYGRPRPQGKPSTDASVGIS